MNNTYEKLIKSFYTGIDFGNSFYVNMHIETDMLARFKSEDLRLLAPKYFIDILYQDFCRKCNTPPIDPSGMFKFMGIEMICGPYEKLILYHVDYPLYKDESMIYEMDLTLFVETHK